MNCSRRLFGFLALTLCCCTARIAPAPDAGAVEVDAGLGRGPGDGGASDAGVLDAGASDAGTDAGPFDGGPTDSGDCFPDPAASYAPFPANPILVDAGAPFECPADAGQVADLDTMIAQMVPGTWRELPCTQMANVCPQPFNHYQCEAELIAWSGAAFDRTREQLVIFGGGHSDGYYSSLFAFDLASARWRRWTDLPAGMTGDGAAPAFSDKRLETCGLYPRTPNLCLPSAWLTPSGYLDPAHCEDPAILTQLDPQAPRSAHTYGNLAFSSATGHFYILGSVGLYPSGQSGAARVDAFDFGARQWSRAAPNPSPGYGTSATDAQGIIWYVSSNGGPLLRFDPTADQWTPASAQAVHGYYGAADVDTARNSLLITSDGLDLATYALSSAGATRTDLRSTGLAGALPGSPGLAYVPGLDRFVAWSGGSTVFFLDPTTWAWKSVQAAGDTPGPAASNGTYGRFRYSPGHHVLIGVSSTQQNVFLYKPPTSAP
jgi:hypothetical protein